MPGPARQAKEAFGGRLREIRLDAGLSSRELAGLTGFHFTKISRVEHGGQGLSDDGIRAWCAACGAEDQVPDLIAQSRAVESMYREWKRQARGGLRRLQETIGPLYERTRCNVTCMVTYVTQWHTCTCLRQRHWPVRPGLALTAIAVFPAPDPHEPEN